MKTILCYGDSNTYGHNPKDGSRFSKDVRWTGVLSKMLGKDYEVIEEGCNGRTTVYDDPFEPWKNGLIYLKPCLNTHKPVDVVIMMLGSNDLKCFFNAGAEEIARGAGRLVDEIYDFADKKQTFRPRVILVAPMIVGESIEQSVFGNVFDKTAIEKSKKFSQFYRQIANEKNCIFIDAGKYVESSKDDGLHLDGQSHGKLARVFYDVITSMT